MGTNGFGTLFRIVTWGESHGPAMGVVIDGCPAGLELDEEHINRALALRSPGNSPFTSPRKEPDRAQILSGLFEGKTTGTPLSIIIYNRDADSSSYQAVQDQLRPGHAQYTYLEKYGIFDYRGGGRASARETVCRVAAGAVAEKLLAREGIQVVAYLSEVGEVGMTSSERERPLSELREAALSSSLFCPHPATTAQMETALLAIKEEGDSLGGVVEVVTSKLPIGLGDPVYEKLEANLAKAMLSIPATKGFEIGEGFAAAGMRGSEHNDLFIKDKENQIGLATNFSGGTLGGISTGMPLTFRVAFKPTSSIRKEQETVTLSGEKAQFAFSKGARHDPCVAIRAVPVVQKMTEIVLVDALLMNKFCKLN